MGEATGTTACHERDAATSPLLRASGVAVDARATYDVLDEGDNRTPGHAVVTVHPVNDVPVAIGGTKDIRGPSAIVLEASDADGDTLTYEVVNAPLHGTLTGTAPALQYTPARNFFGDEAITFRVSDGSAMSEPATLVLHFVSGSPPVAFGDFVNGVEDQPLNLALRASEPDSDPLTFTIEVQPSHGTLTGTAPNLVYTPAPDFAGFDTLAFSASDGAVSSNTATVEIFMEGRNDLPVAVPQIVSTDEDNSRFITLDGFDPDGDFVTFEVTTPLHGTLSGFGAGRTYRPAANYHGPDSFHFTVSNFSGSSTATVTIDVTSVEDLPVARALSRSLSEDTSVAIPLDGSDGDGDPVSFAIATPPAHGVLSGTDRRIAITDALVDAGCQIDSIRGPEP